MRVRPDREVQAERAPSPSIAMLRVCNGGPGKIGRDASADNAAAQG